MLLMSVGWKFNRSSTDEGRSGGNPSEYTFDHDLKDFVRETLQNSNDAGQDRPSTTEVVFELQEFTGTDAEDFLRQLQWDSEDAAGESLGDHVQAVAEAETEASIGHVYGEIEEDSRLVVVTVSDYNTSGLYGPEGGEGPFSALVLDELITEKEGGTGRGGSYGLGKAVLWSWSGLKTVLFTSVPEDTNGNEPPRMIARTQLPSHAAETDVYRFEGRGLFGSMEGSESSTAVETDGEDVIYKWGDRAGRPYSIWGESAAEIAANLGVDRSAQRCGTSISVLGFCEPGGDTQSAPGSIADEIAEEASKWFWPAMLKGDLEVTVETADRTIEVAPDTCDAVVPFIRCVQNRNNTREILDQPGEVGVKSPHFEIEDKNESALQDEDEDPGTESGPISVYARLANPDKDYELSNKVALIRGAGMVVKYYNRSRIVYGGRTFHGVVLAGTARPWADEEPTAADGDIDDYLQAAEPPRHQNWEYTKNLKSMYAGTQSTIVGLQRNIITEAIKDLIRQTREEGRLVAGRLADRLNLPEGEGEGFGDDEDEPSGGPRVFDGTSEISFDRNVGRWTFSGYAQIVADEYEAWEATVSLYRLDEEGNTVGKIPIDEINVKGSDTYKEEDGDDYVIRGDLSVNEFKFEGKSDESPSRGETKINVKGRVLMGRINS